MQLVRNKGFTIVELLIVIVVIAILAAITIVSYTGITVQANDTVRRDGARKISLAYKAYIIQNGKRPINCGASDNGNGFIQYRDADGSGGLYEGPTCVDVLAEAGLLPASFTASIPANTTPNFATNDRVYMVYLCTQAPTNRLLLLWHLQEPSSTEASTLASLISTCATNGVAPYAAYGMNAGEVIEW